MCVLRLPLKVNPRPHTLHLKGFSPVCEDMCATSSAFWANVWKHTSHAWGFSPKKKALLLFK